MGSFRRNRRLVPLRARAVAEPLELRTLLSVGAFDPSFSGDGKLTWGQAAPDQSWLNDIALAPGGGYVAAGWANFSHHHVLVGRFTAAGDPDPSFGNGTGFVTPHFGSHGTDEATRVAVQADGKILVAGFGWVADHVEPALMRLNADGSVDRSFADDGTFTFRYRDRVIGVTDLTTQSDGKIILAGSLSDGAFSNTGQVDFVVARLTADGRLDRTFDDDGVAVTDFAGKDDIVSAVSMLPDGDILVAGSTRYPAPTASDPNAVRGGPGFARYNPDGSLDSSFGGGDGKVGEKVADFNGLGGPVELAVMPDGRFLVAAAADPYALAVARYRPDGSPDPTYDGDGISPTLFRGQTFYLQDLAVAADGSAIVVGQNSSPFVAKFTPSGVPDTTFGAPPGGTSPGYRIDPYPSRGGDGAGNNAVVLLPDGHIVTGGSPGAYNTSWGDIRWVFQRYTADGQHDPNVDRREIYGYEDTYDRAAAVLQQPDGKTIVVARSTLPTEFIAFQFAEGEVLRYNRDGTPDATFGNNGRVAWPDGAQPLWRSAVLLPGGKVLLGGGVAGVNDAGPGVVARLKPDGTLDTTFNRTGYRTLDSTTGPITSLAALSDGQYLIADKSGVRRLGAQGADVPAFGTSGLLRVSNVADLAAVGDGRFYVAARTSVPSSFDPRSMPSPTDTLRLARYNADGTPDITFGRNGDGTALPLPSTAAFSAGAITLDADGRVIVVGAIKDPSSYDDWDTAVVRYGTDGRPDASFDGDGLAIVDLGTNGDWASDVVVGADGRITVGAQTWGGVLFYPRGDGVVFRLNADGSLDRSFGERDARTVVDFHGDNEELAALALADDGDVVAALSTADWMDQTASDVGVARIDTGGAWADAGGPYVAPEGTDLHLTAAAGADPGRSIASVAWDLDYDGSSFQADATTLSAVIPGNTLDGPSTRTVALRVTDSAGDVALRTEVIQVRNVEPEITVDSPDTGQVGVPYTLHLTAADPGDDSITWTVYWGDNFTEPSSAAGRDVTLNHTYAEGRNVYAIQITATDEDGVYTANRRVIIQGGVNDPPVLYFSTIDAYPATVNARAGDVVRTVVYFTDADSGDTHFAIFSWGDGTPDTRVEVPMFGDHADASHAYTADPTGASKSEYAITATVFDDGTPQGVSEQAHGRVGIRYIPPTVYAGPDAQVPEDSPVTLTANVTDDGPADALRYLWHVASAANGQVIADGDRPSFTFTPEDNGNYTVTLTVTDADSQIGTDEVAVSAYNVPPTITVTPPPPAAAEGSPVTLGFSATDPGRDTISQWRIGWGDGQVSTLPGDATSAAHTYDDGTKTYLVTVQATDEDGTYTARPVNLLPLRLDPSFGTNGKANASNAYVFDADLQADGKFVTVYGGPPDPPLPWAVARYNPDGSLDTSFGNAGFIRYPLDLNRSSTAGAIQSDGRIVVAGFDDDEGFLARYNPDGSPDLSFGDRGIVAVRFGTADVNRFFDVAVLPNGKIVAAGTIGNRGAGVDYDLFAARFNSDGSVDTTFGDGGRTPGIDVGVVANQVAGLLVQSDGKIVVGGAETGGTGPNLVDYPVVGRFTADGHPDASFGTSGVTRVRVLSGRFRDFAEAPDGSIVAVGSPIPYLLGGGGLGAVVAKFRPDGTLDRSFRGGGIFPVQAVNLDAVFVTPDGGFFAAGSSGNSPSTGGFYLSRYLASGERDTTFGEGVAFTSMSFGAFGRGTGGTAQALVMQPDGKLVAAGYGGLVRYLLGTYPAYVTNVAPTATFSASPGPYDAGHPVEFHFANSADPSAADVARGLRYSFDFNNDGDFADRELGEVDGGTSATASTTFPTRGTYTVRARIMDKDGGFTDYTTQVDVRGVEGRYVFYNRSAFDGNDAAANAADDGAVAADKRPLLPGQVASFANVTSYTRGINGVMIDLAGVTADPTAADFRFDVTGINSWLTAPAPLSITRRQGAGVDGSDRITVLWADGAIVNRWLRVTVLPGRGTGLVLPDVFYVGNLVGETGDASTPWRVSALDLASVKRALNSTSGVGSALDFNRDGRVNALDLAVARRSAFNTLDPITFQPPAALASDDAAAPSRVTDEVLR